MCFQSKCSKFQTVSSNYPVPNSDPFSLPWNAPCKHEAISLIEVGSTVCPSHICGVWLSLANQTGRHCTEGSIYPLHEHHTSMKAPWKTRVKEENCKLCSRLPWSESTLKHQMWFWSPEDVEPAENSWRGEVRRSVLRRCGDAEKPGKRTDGYLRGLIHHGAERRQTRVCQKQKLSEVRAFMSLGICKLLSNPNVIPHIRKFYPRIEKINKQNWHCKWLNNVPLQGLICRRAHNLDIADCPYDGVLLSWFAINR